MSSVRPASGRSGMRFAPKAVACRNGPVERAGVATSTEIRAAKASNSPNTTGTIDTTSAPSKKKSHDQRTNLLARGDGRKGAEQRVDVSQTSSTPTVNGKPNPATQVDPSPVTRVERLRESQRRRIAKAKAEKANDKNPAKPAGPKAISDQRQPLEESDTSSYSTRSRTGRTKDKQAAQQNGTISAASDFAAARTASDIGGASAADKSPRKRRKVLAKDASSALEANIDRNTNSMTDESPNESATNDVTGTGDESARTSRPKRKKESASAIIQEAAGDVVANALGAEDDEVDDVEGGQRERKRRKRQVDPEEAENHEIEPTEVRMSDLIKDRGLGKTSEREREMEKINWDEVRQKRREAEIEAEKLREAEQEQNRTGRRPRNPGADDPEATLEGVPRMKIVNGAIVVDEDSVNIEKHAGAQKSAAAAAQDETIVLEDIDITKRINSGTVGRPRGVKGKGWDESMEELFYKGLRMFGTDFMMISKMFPGLSRRHIKLKYVREERTNLAKLREHLHPDRREEVDMAFLEDRSGLVYEDPDIVKQELQEMENRMRAEDQARRDREKEHEGVVEQEVNLLQSREQGIAEPNAENDADDEVPIEGETPAADNRNRFASVASSIVADAGRKKQKKTPVQAKKRERKSKKSAGLEGREEVLGSIEEVDA